MNWIERAILVAFILFALVVVGSALMALRRGDPERRCRSWIEDCAKNKSLRECKQDAKAMGCL